MTLGLETEAPWYAGQRLTSEDRLEALASALAACECIADLNDLMRMRSCQAALRHGGARLVSIRYHQLTAQPRLQPRVGGPDANQRTQ